VFVSCSGLEIYRIQVVDRGSETDAGSDRRGPCFEFRRQRRVRRFFKANDPDLASAGLIRRHSVEPLTLSVDDAAARRAEHLVT
jgi:hypothetical protein